MEYSYRVARCRHNDDGDMRNEHRVNSDMSFPTAVVYLDVGYETYAETSDLGQIKSGMWP